MAVSYRSVRASHLEFDFGNRVYFVAAITTFETSMSCTKKFTYTKFVL